MSSSLISSHFRPLSLTTYPTLLPDLDKIEDPNEKKASIGIIHSFGQTPRKVFTSPHPRRSLFGGKIGLPVGVRFGIAENYSILMQSAGESARACFSVERADADGSNSPLQRP